jgi:hypothetical protein
LSAAIAVKSTLNDESSGATVGVVGDVVPPAEPVGLFEELPQALATRATPMATAIAADRFRETCMCFPLWWTALVLDGVVRGLCTSPDAGHGTETCMNDV